jgi:hypothetical protein
MAPSYGLLDRTVYGDRSSGTPCLGEVDPEAGDEVRQVPDQRGELVDDDHQPRQWRTRGLAPGPFGIFLDVLGPGGGQHPFPAGQFGGQRGQRPLGEMGVQVG